MTITQQHKCKLISLWYVNAFTICMLNFIKKQRRIEDKVPHLIILFSNCFACRHFRIQVRQKQWLQFGSIPKRCSFGGFSITTSKQTPHVLSLDRATAKANSISCSCCLMHSWKHQIQYFSKVIHVKFGQNEHSIYHNT